jgi:hypothetical protein
MERVVRACWEESEVSQQETISLGQLRAKNNKLKIELEKGGFRAAFECHTNLS